MLVDLYLDCRDSFTGGLRCWPDGAPLLDQPVKLRQAFSIIAAEVTRCAKDNPA